MQLHFEKSGQGSPLVMMHGLFGSLDNLGAISRILENHFTLYRLDLRNHGRSPHADSMTFAEMAQDLREFFEAQSLQRAFVFGHSLGGKVAMEFACHEPERIAKLIIADIAPVTYPSHHNAILDGLASIELDQVKSRRDADEQLAKFVSEAPIRQFILKSLDRSSEGSYRWRLNVPTILDKYEDLRLAVCEHCNFAGPTLFLRGEHSNYIAERNHDEIKAKFPESSIVTIDGASHWLHAEKPDAVARAIIDFLQ
ncbi:alpha/beta fold hydrolase [Proteobacteria bacterium 005FR1]|nr:alpha/beta fold hydrolase [Proteobacteria bacterium 005FR1]